MKRHGWIAALLWIGLTALGEYLVATVDLFPVGAAREAVIIDEAFQFLMVLGVPVLTFVIAAMLYSMLAFRGQDLSESGRPFHTSRPVTWAWMAITSGLAIFIVFNPGLKGLRELTSDTNQDLTVLVESEQWQWTYTYVEHGITVEDADELVLPVNQRVMFEITASDVIHSFWVPAFRMKVDAMPGRTNVMYVTPTETGSFEDDFNMRVQCAEMCGTGHPRMRTGVTVLAQEDFEQWVEEQGG